MRGYIFGNNSTRTHNNFVSNGHTAHDDGICSDEAALSYVGLSMTCVDIIMSQDEGSRGHIRVCSDVDSVGIRSI